MSNIKKGDPVVVIAGKDKGKFGTVESLDPKDNGIVVSGLNIVSRHTKGRKANDPQGIIKRPAPIDASNVMIVCPTCSKATRIGISVTVGEDGKKVKSRICKKCGASLDVKATKAKSTARKAARQAKKSQKAAADVTPTDNTAADAE